MTHIASRLATVRVAALVALVAVGGAIALATSGTAAAATTGSAPKLTVSFTPSEIGVGDSSGLGYTLTDPNSSGSLYNISFSDQLPADIAVDNPTGLATSGCGSPTITATPGASTVSVSGVTVKSGTNCAITLSVTGTAPGQGAETLSGFSYSTTASGSTTAVPTGGSTTYESDAAIDVIALPTATIKTPTKNAVYTYGQKVKASFTCAAPDDVNGPTLADCLGQDDLGNTITSGGYLDTSVAGKHYLQVQAINTLGDITNAQVNYTVLPDNVVAIRSAKSGSAGASTLTLKVPGKGKLVVTETSGKSTVASTTVSAKRLYAALAVKLRLNATGKKLLAGAKNKLKVTVKIAYTPTGGRRATVTKTITLK